MCGINTYSGRKISKNVLHLSAWTTAPITPTPAFFCTIGFSTLIWYNRYTITSTVITNITAGISSGTSGWRINLGLELRPLFDYSACSIVQIIHCAFGVELWSRLWSQQRCAASLVTRFFVALRSHALSESGHSEPLASDYAPSPPRSSRLRRRLLPPPAASGPQHRSTARVYSSPQSLSRQFASVLVTWNVKERRRICETLVAGFVRGHRTRLISEGSAIRRSTRRYLLRARISSPLFLVEL